jgi:hypothetical protein
MFSSTLHFISLSPNILLSVFVLNHIQLYLSLSVWQIKFHKKEWAEIMSSI